MLSDISNCDYGYIEHVLLDIDKVKTGEIDKCSFGGSDYCIIDVFREKSVVMYDFGESETEIPTDDLVKLLQDWSLYLKKVADNQ